MCKNIINPEKELVIYMESYAMFIAPHPEFPGRIIAKEWVQSDDPVIYVPEIQCTAQMTIYDDDSIGHCVCSNCCGSIRYFDKYCSHCGGKIVNTEICETPPMFTEGGPNES